MNRIDVGALRERRFGAAALAVVLVVGLAVGFLVQRYRGGTGAQAPEEAAEHAAGLPPGIVEVPEAAQKNAGLQIFTAATRSFPAAIEVTGAVAPAESRMAHVRPLARGVVENISVTLGARVELGQGLVTYDNIELGELVGSYLSEVSALRQAEADLQVKQRSLERAQELIKLEAVAQQTLDLRQAEFKNAQAAVSSQKARVAQIEEQIHRFGLSEADVRRLSPTEGSSAHRTASHSVLRAPFSGVVTKVDVANGELVGPDRELMTITDISTVWVLADVYEKDVAKVRPGTDVVIKVDSYPDRTFTGRLTYVSDLIDPQTRTAKVRCVVANPLSALKLDMFAKVSIPTTERRDGIVVPVAAVQQIDGKQVVFVRQSATRFEQRRVEVGLTAGGFTEIRAGLRPGEVIAGAGSFYLKTAAMRDRIGDED